MITQEQMEELFKITVEEFKIFEKISKLIDNVGNLYICEQETCINWIGRTVVPGEIISENTYNNSQDFNKRCLKKLSISDIVVVLKNGDNVIL